MNVDTIAGIVRKLLPEAEHHFPEDYITDRSQRFMASEIIREKLMRFGRRAAVFGDGGNRTVRG